MYKETELSEEEQKEALRHDKFYKVEGKAWKLSSHDWEKFDLVEKPTHGYIYSVKCLGNIKHKNVLDLGCGTGWLSVILAKRGANVEAIDISAEAIKVAYDMAKVNQVHDMINFKVGSVYELEYPNNYFDFVIGQAILHHLTDKNKLIPELYRILKLKGKAIFFEPFGESETLEKIRLLIPVPIDDVDKINSGKKLTYKDIEVLGKFFTVKHKEFHLVSRLDRIIVFDPFVKLLSWIDITLLRLFPFLRKYARSIVVELLKEK